jgi:hypothetical protein
VAIVCPDPEPIIRLDEQPHVDPEHEDRKRGEGQPQEVVRRVAGNARKDGDEGDEKDRRADAEKQGEQDRVRGERAP